MVNLTNPINLSAGYALNRCLRQIAYSTTEMATGIKKVTNIADYVIGSQLRSSAAILYNLSTNVSYGTNLLSVVASVLASVVNKLIHMREIIVQAGIASNTKTLSELNILYKNCSLDILRLLSSTKFDGKSLFDGSFADFGPNVPAQELPREASPLFLRVGESIANNIKIAIPKLLAGKGNVGDLPVTGRFAPLFPVTAAAAAAVLNIDHNLITWGDVNVLLAGNDVETAVYNAAKAAGIAAGGDPNAMAGDDDPIAAAAAIRAARAAARDVSTGNLLNMANQIAADSIVSSALNLVSSQLATVNMHLQSLQQTIEVIDSLIVVNSRATDSYLNTDYAESAKRFSTNLLAMQGTIFILVKCYLISEAVLELITEL